MQRQGQVLISKAEVVTDRLDQLYARRRLRVTPPLDELIRTVLSQNTSDVNSSRAYESLRERFSTWMDVHRAPAVEIEEAIRSGGLARSKTRTIKGILERIAALLPPAIPTDPTLDLNLDWLIECATAEARAYLLSFPGVGPKTSACVLLFSLERPMIPVDTHVHRIARRIGLSRALASPEEVESDLESTVPSNKAYSCHVNLIAHGQRVCIARVPRCGECVILDLCLFGQDSFAGLGQRTR